MRASTHGAVTTVVLGLLWLAPTVARNDTPHVPAYPTLTANPDLVLCGPYGTIQSGAANWGTGISGGAHTREFFTLANNYRVRQTGIIQRIRVNLQDATGLTGFYFRLWRKIGTTYDMVGSSENLAPVMAVGPNTLELKRPIAALEGDFYGYRIESTAAANFYARSGVRSRSVTDGNVPVSDFDWQAQSPSLSRALPIEMYMRAPVLVGIGDSIISGYPNNHTLVESDLTTLPETDIVSYLGEQWRVTRQNMAIPADPITDVVARFTTDVVNLKPRLALLEGGPAANIARSDGLGQTLDTYLSTFKKLLDACQANSIKPVVLLILPGGPGTTLSQARQIDGWNAALRELAKGYAGAVTIDASTYVGAARSDGPAGNLWRIDPAFSAGDPWHCNPAGYHRIAQAIVDQYTEP